MNWSPQQDAALIDLKRWWNNGKPATQEYLLFGFAGTGKTTLAKTFPELLGLRMYTQADEPKFDEAGMREEVSDDEPQRLVIYCSFTGKAASVLRRKGLWAYTIHQTIYGRPMVDEAKIDALVQKIAKQEEAGDPMLGHSIAELKRMLQPSFGVKSLDAKAAKCSAIVVDECSMIDERLYLDLCGFGIPIIFMGDPAQLPPVGKSAGLIERKPDTMLSEIHRQALDNPILELATELRKSPTLPKLFLPELVVTNEQLDAKGQSEFDQTICGYHTTRRKFNNQRRILHGFDEFPQGKGEKLINLKNDHQLKIMNGEMIELNDVNHGEDDKHFFMGKMVDFYTKEKLGDKLGTTQTIYNGYFKDTTSYQDGRIQKEWRIRADGVEVDWGYAITCHKSQGSEWDSVFIQDDGFGRSNLDRCRWLYTALTRARTTAFISSRFAV